MEPRKRSSPAEAKRRGRCQRRPTSSSSDPELVRRRIGLANLAAPSSTKRVFIACSRADRRRSLISGGRKGGRGDGPHRRPRGGEGGGGRTCAKATGAEKCGVAAGRQARPRSAHR